MTGNNEIKLFRFLEWSVYKNTRSLCKEILELVNRLPNQIRFYLGDQIVRSSTSILLNIAEGSGKNSDKELNRYFDIAIGSVNETVANLDFLRDNRFITEQQFSGLFVKLQSISKQIGGFKKILRR